MIVRSFLSVVGSIATVALIAVATRWLSSAEGEQFPKALGGASVYGIKWQWRAIGLVGGIFWAALSIWSWFDRYSSPDGLLIAISLVFVMAGLWLASGSVITNQVGITKRSLWHSRSFQWKDITEIRVYKKQGGAIELRSGSRKLVIDSRFDAFQHLLSEIENHTRLGAC
jgi:hypothetical protein